MPAGFGMPNVGLWLQVSMCMETLKALHVLWQAAMGRARARCCGSSWGRTGALQFCSFGQVVVATNGSLLAASQLSVKDSARDVKGVACAVAGGNGAGKSTLLRLIMGQEKPVEGEVSLGEHMIKPNYYEQNQSEALDPNLTVLKTLELAAPDAELQDIKAILGRMMFSGSAMDKKVQGPHTPSPSGLTYTLTFTGQASAPSGSMVITLE